MKVLAYTATFEEGGRLAMRPECRASVESQVFDGEIVWEVGLHNPWPYATHKNVLAQYQRAREMALEGGFDALWTFEHDMTCGPDALQRLSYTPAQVVYGVYLLRHGSWVLNAWEYVNDRNLGESLSLYPGKVAAARARGAVRVSGCGWGCTLIHRPVLERFEFHDEGGENPAGDLAFAKDVLRAKVASVARFDVACDHFDEGLRLRPFGGAVSDVVKVRALANVVAPGDVVMKRGGEYEVERKVVGDLVRAGYVEEVGGQESASDELRVTSEEGPEVAAMGGGERAVMRKGRRRREGL